MTLTTEQQQDLHYGEVFTRPWVVEVILDLVGYTSDRDLGTLQIVEPSVGSGAFLGPIVARLLESARRHGRTVGSLRAALRGYELQASKVDDSRRLVQEMLGEAGVESQLAGEIAEVWISEADFLLADMPVRTADFVVGNPPYIRYDDLDERTAATYRRLWPTMHGRGDIYVGFFERGLELLAPEGRLGYICADRWMRNSYGAELRQHISGKYSVDHVWTMHDVDAFETQVSAYPAITVISNRPQGVAVVADTTVEFGESSARKLTKAVNSDGFEDFRGGGVRAHSLAAWFTGSDLWPAGSPVRLALLERLNEHFYPLQDPATGTKISIGIATGADNVYVTKDPTVAEADRMLPLAMRRDLMSGHFDWRGNYLVNPWNEDGSLVDLAEYPRMAAYLASHPKLRERFVAKKSPDSWHRTIDKVQPGLTAKPKLLLQDMKSTIHPVLETGGHYPHHNLYYVTSEVWDMEVLGGLLLSRIAQSFIEAYGVRMRGGTLRFQAQYLKRIRVPDPTTMKDSTKEQLRTAFRTRDVTLSTNAAAAAYGIDPEEYELD